MVVCSCVLLLSVGSPLFLHCKVIEGVLSNLFSSIGLPFSSSVFQVGLTLPFPALPKIFEEVRQGYVNLQQLPYIRIGVVIFFFHSSRLSSKCFDSCR